MQNKKQLIEILERKSDLIVQKKYADKATLLQNYLLEKYEFSRGSTMDYVSRRANFEAAPDYELFWYSDGINHVFNCIELSSYFNNTEIKEYSKTKKNNNKIEFPIRIPCVQIDEHQWIGRADVQFFIKLRKASMIIYNANAQRALKKVLKGDTEFWKIQLNRFAVSQISDSFKSGSYIPNTITLNISDESKGDFYYDDKTHELVIKSIESFDISDGYHRYIAMSQLYDFDNTFNYPMELRIINFDDEKVKQFIFQEDQKTKMTKIVSNSMNLNKSCNKIVERLNNNSLSYLKGKISRAEGLVDFSQFASLVDRIFFDNKNCEDPSVELEIYKTIQGKLNTLIELNEKYMTEKYTYVRMAAVLFAIKYHEDLETIDDCVETLEKIIASEKFVKTRKISKVDEERISKYC